jgi:hypothetical protein
LKNIISIILFIAAFKTADAQKLDSLYFNLYTDSLKKGTFNYINVDGRYSDGRYQPLTAKELIFTCDAGKFEGNSLFLDASIKLEKVVVKVSLKTDPAVTRERTIFIKKFEDSSGVKTMEQVMQPKRRNGDNEL